MFHNLVNTRYFSEAASDFKKNGGYYTTAPRGSREYFEYWQMWEERCRVGMTVGDLWIPGRMVFYLNFTPIWKIKDEDVTQAIKERRDSKGKVSKRTAEKIFDFPKFWEVHYEWWNYKHIAWHGGTFGGITSPGGKHIGAAKARGAGWSYLEASDGVYNYNFIPGSKNYYFAGTQAYLDQDGTLNKVQSQLDFINDNIPYWKQNRQKKNQILYQRASYLDEFGSERGSMSEIIGQVVDNPNKTRGKRGRKTTFEEFGSFPNSKQALEINLSSMRSGSFYVGQIDILGTGGEEGPGIEGLESVFSEPQSWDMLVFPDIWEGADYQDTEVGTSYFVPSWRVNEAYMDENGNVDAQGAIQYDKGVRAMKAKSKDPKILDRYKAENPWYPSEAFQRMTFNMFPIAELDAQIRRVKTNKAIQALIRHGSLRRSPKGVVFSPIFRDNFHPVIEYPHKHDQDLTGAITIYEKPFQDQLGHVPGYIYSIVVDPFYKEESNDLTSLFVAYVIKHYNNVDPVSEGLPVASYIGRPQDLKYAYEQLFMLADYYGGALIQSEIAGGGQGIVDYARERRLLHYLEHEPEMLHNKDFYKPGANGHIFMNMPTEKKRLGLTYLADYTRHLRGFNDNGTRVLNIHRIYDLGLLQEMRKFNPEKGNFDRVSAMIIAMFMLKERVALAVEQTREDSEFYDRELFGSAGTAELTSYA